jgi:hypothetical protein
MTKIKINKDCLNGIIKSQNQIKKIKIFLLQFEQIRTGCNKTLVNPNEHLNVTRHSK